MKLLITSFLVLAVFAIPAAAQATQQQDRQAQELFD